MGLLAYTLGLNPGPAVAGVNAFKGAMSGMQSAATGALGKITAALGLVGVGFAAFKTAGGFADALKGVFEAGKELNTTRAITGQTITDLVVLRKAFKEVGLDAGGVAPSIGMLQKSLGGMNEEGQPTVGMFARLHLSINSLKGQSAVTQLQAIGGAIAKLGNQEEKVAAVRAIFGRQGTEMLALFGDPAAIRRATADMKGYSAIMEKDAGLFKEITNTLESLSTRMKGFFVGFADKVGPVLLPMLTKLKETLNFTGFGAKIGAEIGAAARLIHGLFLDDKIGLYMGLSLKVGFADAMEFLSNTMSDIFDNAPSMLKGLKDALGEIGDLMEGLGDVLAGSLKKGLASVLRDIHVTNPLTGNRINAIEPGTADRMKEQGEFMQKMGLMRAKLSVAAMGEKSTMGHIAGGVTDFMDGLMTDTKEAREKLMEIKSKALATDKKSGLFKEAVAEKPVAKGLGQSLLPIPEIKPLSDRLSKIGGFIGGSGGVRAEKAAQDTARNTFLMVEMMRSANALRHGPQRAGSRF